MPKYVFKLVDGSVVEFEASSYEFRNTGVVLRKSVTKLSVHLPYSNYLYMEALHE